MWESKLGFEANTFEHDVQGNGSSDKKLKFYTNFCKFQYFLTHPSFYEDVGYVAIVENLNEIRSRKFRREISH